MKQEYIINNYSELKNLNLLYSLLFSLKIDRSFIEIGAYDGETNSKTAVLADLGWKGVYVEPISEFFIACKKRHSKNPSIDVLNYAIDDRNGNSTIYKHKMASTLLVDNKAIIEETSNGVRFKCNEVVIRSWDGFLNDINRMIPTVFVLDAEGKDWTIVKQIDFKVFRPQIIFCEVFSANTKFISKKVITEGQKIHKELLDEGYYLWIIEKHNRVYVSNTSISDWIKNNNVVINTETIPLIKQAFQTAYLNKNRLECEKIYSILVNLKANDFEEEIEVNQLNSNWDLIVEKINEFHQNNQPTQRIVELLLIALNKTKAYQESIWAFEFLLKVSPNNIFLKQQYLLTKQILEKKK
jgi:FkbM family methyltransferase